MDTYLVISALGSDKPGLVDQLSSSVLDCGCNIVDSRMTVLGGEFAVLLMISGRWNAVTKLEDSLDRLRQKLGLTIIATRTEHNTSTQNLVPYTIDVVAIDHPGIVHQIARFFSQREINIQELNTNRYSAAHTGTAMFAMSMTVNIPSGVRIAGLREEFLEFCDDLNLDAVLEPQKN